MRLVLGLPIVLSSMLSRLETHIRDQNVTVRGSPVQMYISLIGQEKDVHSLEASQKSQEENA